MYILELVFFYVLDTFDPLGTPKSPLKEQKVIFRDRKIREGVMFCWFFVQKFFGGLFYTYIQEDAAIWANPRALLIGFKVKNRRGGA